MQVPVTATVEPGRELRPGQRTLTEAGAGGPLCRHESALQRLPGDGRPRTPSARGRCPTPQPRTCAQTSPGCIDVRRLQTWCGEEAKRPFHGGHEETPHEPNLSDIFSQITGVWSSWKIKTDSGTVTGWKGIKLARTRCKVGSWTREEISEENCQGPTGSAGESETPNQREFSSLGIILRLYIIL